MSAKFDFTGKKALVTGASRGIGNAIAIALSKAGANVVALARDRTKLEELRSQHANIFIIVGDVTSSESALSTLLAPYQPFDILVNNAGTGTLEASHSLSEQAVTRQLDTNLKAPIIITKIVASEMIRSSIRGAIVNISSQASMRPLDDHTAYCKRASKAGLDMATRCFAKEFGRCGIRVNNVNPTVVMTDLARPTWSDPNRADPLLSQMPLGRFAEMDEVVNAVLFLLSDLSSMTTGLAFPVDGGFSLA
ncbi:oxidoreductase, short chain dehydrogenase/reductase family protein [Oesophagostomum dentatum]|uniref:Oxidoreductase, short chain dehydrogenase/reductase family protein n=1 Tax=Oesophagostomum dentatum TaxID=61180 RepID=A0A0B1TKS0_OESDE|nr:oxidoreductase, short chain dehydrogenase/reductase family protein [Oesophagostomum dentatum]